MWSLIEAALIVSASILVADPPRTMDALLERLVVPQAGATCDATLRPFSIEIPQKLRQTTRDIVFVAPEVFHQILGIAREATNMPRQSRSGQHGLSSKDFNITHYQAANAIAVFPVSSDDLKSIMGIIDKMFQSNGVATPAWIRAIENQPL
jgi:hypothetical protein